MVPQNAPVIRLVLLNSGLLCLLFVCLQLYAAPASGIQPKNPGFWHDSQEGEGPHPSQPVSRKRNSADKIANDDAPEAMDLHYQQFSKKMKQRVALISSEIRKHWPEVEISGRSKWVEYGSDWKSKRVVDYASNEIRVSSLEDMNHKEIRVFAQDELKALLGMTILVAIQRDPSLGSITNAVTDDSLDELVFSELFKAEEPSSEDISKLARRLMQHAYLRYQKQTPGYEQAGESRASKQGTYIIPLPKNRMREKAKEYLPYVKKYSNEFQIPADVMMAIMHTESHFNPLARSHTPAFGLMQIVPRTAGRDASRVLFKKKKLLTAGFLYQPENNIKVGAAYLNVLNFQYLKKIENPVSRLYCMIAAYNTGSANVARAFTPAPQMQKAVGIINTMSNQQVLMRLIKYLPQRETREYVEKVLKRRKNYSRT